MKTTVFPRPQYSLFVTQTPFESTVSEEVGYLATVNPDSYVEVGVDDSCTYYVSESQPIPNLESVDVDFEIADNGDWYEDDYTTVRVFPDRIVFVVK